MPVGKKKKGFDLSKLLAILIKEKGLKLYQNEKKMAEACHVSYRTFRYWKTGSPVDIAYFDTIAKAFDIPPAIITQFVNGFLKNHPDMLESYVRYSSYYYDDLYGINHTLSQLYDEEQFNIRMYNLLSDYLRYYGYGESFEKEHEEHTDLFDDFLMSIKDKILDQALIEGYKFDAISSNCPTDMLTIQKKHQLERWEKRLEDDAYYNYLKSDEIIGENENGEVIKMTRLDEHLKYIKRLENEIEECRKIVMQNFSKDTDSSK